LSSKKASSPEPQIHLIKDPNTSSVNEIAYIDPQHPVFWIKSLRRPFSASRSWQRSSSFRQGLHYTIRVKTPSLAIAAYPRSSDVRGPKSIGSDSHSTAPSPPMSMPLHFSCKSPAVSSQAPEFLEATPQTPKWLLFPLQSLPYLPSFEPTPVHVRSTCLQLCPCSEKYADIALEFEETPLLASCS
jgi:hypothetical protein